MSHRRKPTDADRFVDRLLSLHPRLEGVRKPVWSGSELVRELFFFINESEGQNIMAMDAYMENYRHTNDPTLLIATEISLWSNWRQCRHVYRFDKALTDELCATDAPDSMPTDALASLPYPIVYVDAPCDLYTYGGVPVPVRGYFAWYDTSRTVDMRPERSLSLTFVTPEFGRGSTSMVLSLEKGTLGEVVDDVVARDRNHIDYLRNKGFDVEEVGIDESIRSTIVSVMNHLLYIVSENSDQQVTYRPSGKARNARRSSPSTIHEVGTHVGRALGAARVVYVSSEAAARSNGTSPRAHMRAGHWHHHWVGPMSKPDERRLVLRWHDPVFVNAGRSGDGIDTVVHPAAKN